MRDVAPRLTSRNPLQQPLTKDDRMDLLLDGVDELLCEARIEAVRGEL